MRHFYTPEKAKKLIENKIISLSVDPDLDWEQAKYIFQMFIRAYFCSKKQDSSYVDVARLLNRYNSYLPKGFDLMLSSENLNHLLLPHSGRVVTKQGADEYMFYLCLQGSFDKILAKHEKLTGMLKRLDMNADYVELDMSEFNNG